MLSRSCWHQYQSSIFTLCWLNDIDALPCQFDKKISCQFSHDYLHVLDLLQTKNMEKTELSKFFSTFGKVNVERAQLAISCCLVYKTVALLVCKTSSAWLHKHHIKASWNRAAVLINGVVFESESGKSTVSNILLSCLQN